MDSFTITVELDRPLTAGLAAMTRDVLDGYRPAVHRSRRGRASIVVTVPIDHLHGATMVVLGLVHLHELGLPVALHVQSTADHESDRQLVEPVPSTVLADTPSVSVSASRSVGADSTPRRCLSIR